MKFTIIFLGIFIWLFFGSTVEGHLAGQPPYFMVNGRYSNLYPVPLTSLDNFELPQDLTPDKYLVNRMIKFELDVSKLPAPPEIVLKTKFNWDFGDGGEGHGLAMVHTYSKIGSYIIKIYADDGTTPKPQLLESAFINIVPNLGYSLPQAVIKINGQTSNDPLTDILQFNLSDSLSFDGSASIDQSGKVISYLWDYGDQKSENIPKSSHKYSNDLSQIFPVLRVKDENGFIADNFVEIQNKALLQNDVLPSKSSLPVENVSPKKDMSGLIKLVLVSVIIFLTALAGKKYLKRFFK